MASLRIHRSGVNFVELLRQNFSVYKSVCVRMLIVLHYKIKYWKENTFLCDIYLLRRKWKILWHIFSRTLVAQIVDLLIWQNRFSGNTYVLLPISSNFTVIVSKITSFESVTFPSDMMTSLISVFHHVHCK